MDGAIEAGGVWRGVAPWQERWQATESLPGGQFCDAYVARRADGGDPTPRFLKVLRRGVEGREAARLHEEAASLAAFDHPRIPRLIEANTQHHGTARDLQLYLVTDLVPGPTLADLGADRLPLPLSVALDLSSRLLDAVSHVHERGRSHTDIRPKNVMMRGADPADPVLVDFNLSIPVGSVAGAIADRLVIDWRNDLQGVARILFWGLTGQYHVPLRDWYARPPHRRTYEMRAIQALGAQLSPLLDELFDRAFALEVRDRFQSVEELRAAMDRIRATLGPGRAAEGAMAETGGDDMLFAPHQVGADTSSGAMRDEAGVPSAAASTPRDVKANLGGATPDSGSIIHREAAAKTSMLELLFEQRFDEYFSAFRRNAPLWVFVHVPKTAGSSLRGELASVMAPEANIFAKYDASGRTHHERVAEKVAAFIAEHRRTPHRFASGHIYARHVEQIEQAAGEIRRVTMLRHPVKRVISDYRYQGSPMHPGHEGFRRRCPTLGDYLKLEAETNKAARHLAPSEMVGAGDKAGCIDYTGPHCR